MNYIEELKFGDAFKYNENHYVLSCDKKNNGDSFCLNLKTGMPIWLSQNDIVERCQLFIIDENNHFIALKETPKDDIS